MAYHRVVLNVCSPLILLSRLRLGLLVLCILLVLIFLDLLLQLNAQIMLGEYLIVIYLKLEYLLCLHVDHGNSKSISDDYHWILLTIKLAVWLHKVTHV